MQVKCFCLGSFQTNAYVLWEEGEKTCAVVDPGEAPAPLLAFLHDRSLRPAAIILTHGHADHLAGVSQVKSTFGEVPVWVGEGDSKRIRNSLHNLSAIFFRPISLPPADRLLHEGESIQVGSVHLEVLGVPGHTSGSIALYAPQEGIVFSGDSLFAEGVGRTDLPGSSHKKLIHSIHEKLFALPDETAVYPGHGPSTTIGHERRYNPFLAGEPVGAM